MKLNETDKSVRYSIKGCRLIELKRLTDSQPFLFLNYIANQRYIRKISRIVYTFNCWKKKYFIFVSEKKSAVLFSITKEAHTSNITT